MAVIKSRGEEVRLIGHVSQFKKEKVRPFNPVQARRGFVVGQHRRSSTMTQTLKTLFKDIPTISTHGELHIPVERLVTDSRRVVPGAVFFAISGLHTNGNLYIDEAISRGAAAIISDEPYARTFGNLTHIQVDHARRVLAQLAARFYNHPDRELDIVGITGTNGKTTVASLSQFLLETEPSEVGMLGTIHYDLGQRTLPAYKTTPESVDIYAMLQQMHENGCASCVMEISSHAIDQFRVEGLEVDVAVFLNLTQDHMDYHQNMEAYFEVKQRLFNGKIGHRVPCVVVNLDDPYGRMILDSISSEQRSVTFGHSPQATIRAENVELSQEGSTFDVVWPQGRGTVRTHLPGYYNVSNILAALAVAYAQGRNLETLLSKVRSFPGVPGRMEPVDAGQNFQVLVDYAHTDNALENALGMLRPITPGRLLVVFGCGGDRDRSKRPKMVDAVQRFADFAWATSDNPRKEKLEQIFDDMRKGIRKNDTIEFLDDRRSAIGKALDAAKPGDCVLIAGKGHEAFQEFANMVVPFDDRQIVREWIHLKAHRKGVVCS